MKHAFHIYLCAAGALAGCTLLLGIHDDYSRLSDAQGDAPIEAGDALSEAADAPVATYNDLTDPSKWAAFDVSTVNPKAKGFIGAGFDGRYLYLVPYNNG